MILPLAGLPRSGTTLFRSILQQNPKIHVTPYSGLLESLGYIINGWNNLAPHKGYSRDDALKRVLKSAIETYHDHPINLDVDRSWPTNIELVENLTDERVNIVCFVRPMTEVISSIEYLTRLNPEKKMTLSSTAATTEERTHDYLNGFVGNSYRSIVDALDRSLGDRLLFINYRDFIADPIQQINKMNNHWGIEPFNYTATPTELLNKDNDNAYGMALHTIKDEIKTYSPPPEEILGKRICQLIESTYPSFWEK